MKAGEIAGLTPIRVVLLTGGAVLEREVVDFLDLLEADKAIDVVGVYSETSRVGLWGVFKDLCARRGLLAVPLVLQRSSRAIWRFISAPGRALRQKKMLRNLEDRIFYVESLHEPSVLAAIRTQEPALGLLYGGPIIKRALFSLPKHGTLGIHHGSVPKYRGKKTTFWAMYNGEKEVGVIIQQINDKLDGGDVIRERLIPVGKKPIMVVKKRLEREGMRLYLEAIHAVRAGSVTRRPQHEKTESLYKDPGAADILKFWGRYLICLVGTKR